jgi:hypothetical protein
MTRRTNARIAGFTFLFYIAAGITSMRLFAGATSGEGVAAKLAGIAQHATAIRLTVLLNPIENLSALVLAVTLYAITREQDRDLALLAMACRLAEGIGGMDVSRALGLLWLTTATGATAPDAAATPALGAFLLNTGGWGATAFFFAVGSTLFSWLLLRGRMIPVALAWLGVFASILLVVYLPLQLAGLLGPVTSFIWFPILLFEVVLGLWLIIKGVAAPTPRQPA